LTKYILEVMLKKNNKKMSNQKLSVTVFAEPCYPDGLELFDVISEKQCSQEIKNMLLDRMLWYKNTYAEHGLFKDGYPSEGTSFRLIPRGEKSKDNNFAPFAALWLPSLLLQMEEIAGQLPEEMKGRPIVGFDTNFSFFGENAQLLYIETTPEGVRLALKKCAPHEIPKDWLCLVEA
jgi:hypothetical protein